MWRNLEDLATVAVLCALLCPSGTAFALELAEHLDEPDDLTQIQFQYLLMEKSNKPQKFLSKGPLGAPG